jgi:hypothetical protein
MRRSARVVNFYLKQNAKSKGIDYLVRGARCAPEFLVTHMYMCERSHTRRSNYLLCDSGAERESAQMNFPTAALCVCAFIREKLLSTFWQR